jgi:hypothetical protein
VSIERCNRCGEEFLTEADPYFVEPLKGYELSCTCRIKSLRTQLKASEARERKLTEALVIWRDACSDDNGCYECVDKESCETAVALAEWEASK